MTIHRFHRHFSLRAHKRKSRLLSCEPLEARLNLSVSGVLLETSTLEDTADPAHWPEFAGRLPDAKVSSEAIVATADMDGDGDHDLVMAETIGRHYTQLSWLEFDSVSGRIVGYNEIAALTLLRTEFRVGDFTGDGTTDVLAATGASPLLLFANDGTGGFAPATSIPDSTPGRLLEVLDVNQDEGLDIVTTDGIFVSQGEGEFELVRTPRYRSGPLTAADIDGDGQDEIVFGSTWFELGSTRPVFLPESPNFVADFDGDGDPDLLTSRRADLTVSLNDGTGNFSGRIFQNVLRSASILGWHDLDGDGDLDALASIAPDAAAWLEFDGLNMVQHDLPLQGDVNVADLNGDGTLDLWGPDELDRSAVTVLTGDGAGGFEQMPPVQFISDFAIQRTADLDQDGIREVLSHRGPELFPVSVGEHGFEEFGAPLSKSFNLSTATFVDIDGDGDLDGVYVDDSTVWLQENDGSGQLGTPAVLTEELQPFPDVERLIIEDLDGDGDLDIVANYIRSARVGVHRPRLIVLQGEDGFALQQVIPPVIVETEHNDGMFGDTFLDLDGDGDKDLVDIATNRVLWAEFSGNGEDGPFEAPQILAEHGLWAPDVFGAADVNGDGADELFIKWGDLAPPGAERGPQRLGWLDVTADSVEVRTIHEQESIIRGPTLADLDDDQHVDIVFSSRDQDRDAEGSLGQVDWLRNRGSGQFGNPQTIAFGELGFVGDIDRDGDLDLSVREGWRVGGVEIESRAFTWLRNDARDRKLRSDFNDDGVIDFDDFLAFAAAWQDRCDPENCPPEPQPGDIDADGSIGFGDFLIFAALFGEEFG